MMRIGDIFHAVNERELHRFYLTVVRKCRFFFAEFKSVKDIECHQCHKTMTVRRDLPYIVAVVADGDGVYPFGFVFREVFPTDITARRT